MDAIQCLVKTCVNPKPFKCDALYFWFSPNPRRRTFSVLDCERWLRCNALLDRPGNPSKGSCRLDISSDTKLQPVGMTNAAVLVPVALFGVFCGTCSGNAACDQATRHVIRQHAYACDASALLASVRTASSWLPGSGALPGSRSHVSPPYITTRNAPLATPVQGSGA